MTIFDYTNEDALDLLVDLVEPVGKIMTDKELKKAMQKGASKMECIKIAIRNNKKAIVEILARIEGVDVSEYKCNALTITRDMIALLNNPELADFFTSSQQKMEQTISIKPMESTEAKEN